MQQDKKTSLALFDLDGTITKKDTFVPFLSHASGKSKTLIAFIMNAHHLIFSPFSNGQRNKLKNALIKNLFSGLSETKLEEFALTYSKKFSENEFESFSHDQIKWHLSQGHQIVIVTASLHAYAKLIGKKLDIDRVIATELECIDGVLTGMLFGQNCNHEEKKRRILREVQLDDFREIYAYGNSSGDEHMLSLANHKYLKGKKLEHK